MTLPLDPPLDARRMFAKIDITVRKQEKNVHV